jgi:hypothetical protein
MSMTSDPPTLTATVSQGHMQSPVAADPVLRVLLVARLRQTIFTSPRSRIDLGFSLGVCLLREMLP